MISDEALRMRKCPGIYFADEPAGREAKIAGTGLAVWEIIGVCKAVSKDNRAFRARFPWLTEAQIKAALLYYRSCSGEIGALVAENEALSTEIPPLELSVRARKA